MSKVKRILSLVLVLILLVSASTISFEAKTKTIVEQRLEEIEKLYPQDSTFDGWVRGGHIEYGGCGGLVAFATNKIFHNTYYDDSPNYKKVGSASTTSTSAMQSLFKKAKVGDVIQWYRSSGSTAHLALFMSYTSTGIKIYEANFGGINQVWYNHFWPWGGMDDWPSGGATTVTVYRSKNYNKVNEGKAAVKLQVGEVVEYNYEYNNSFTGDYGKTNIKFKILDNSINNPLAVITSSKYETNTDNKLELPKAIYYVNGNVSLGSTYLESEYLNYNEYYKVVTTDELAPKKVKNVTVKNKTKGALTVSWKKTKDTTGYQIFRSTEKNGTYTKIKKIKGSATTFTDKTVKKGTKYYYKVRAYKTIAKTKFFGKLSATANAKVKK